MLNACANDEGYNEAEEEKDENEERATLTTRVRGG